MRKTVVNKVHLEGLLYEHKLEKRISGEKSKNPGLEFIRGKVAIATSDDLMNVVQVNFSYCPEYYVDKKTGKPKPNTTYQFLQDVIDEKIGTVTKHGKENAAVVRYDGSIGLNEWFKDGELISTKCNDGGFFHQIQASELTANPRNRATFNIDMLVTGTRRSNGDPEKDLPEKVYVKGFIFDFRKELLPVEVVAYEPFVPAIALDFFENMGATPSTPIFTRIEGEILSRSIVRTIEEKDAWGGTKVKEVPSSQKDYVINWADGNFYPWEDEVEGITAAELSEKMAHRELHVAELKANQEEWQEARKNSTSAFVNATPSGKKYNF